MRFVLHTKALNGQDESFRLIDRLIDRAADQIHRIELSDPDLLKDSGWYREARQIHRKLMTAAAATPPRKHSGLSGPHAKHVDVCNLESALLADKLAHAPLTILVEDREADGELLDILVEELGSLELRTLWTHSQTLTPPGVEFENSGGISAMPERVKRALSDAALAGRPIRFFVLCDSDARWPGDNGPSNSSITKLRTTCSDARIPLHVLKKRSAENYIPDTVIKAVRDDPCNASNVDRFDALLRRTPVQRDHFPFKAGLQQDERASAIAKGLYNASEVPDLERLTEPLFPKKPRPLKRLRNERRSEFTDHALRNRDGRGEIANLLDTLAREL
ncbi:MAG: hypothetical protein DVS81_17535 [Candidatus Accumulibacter meliphilus]|jgi:hypothetical protein|uniref:Uncharacterized protein n=1 Tax=Candidatus Accumulibacter meliphilus TaxID=2211374 RepID=A0A369XGP9_9PROT|nr:MAG: hypothetical protein DVS81_17535 [Candidatus Accumulibacter meliphilus]